MKTGWVLSRPKPKCEQCKYFTLPQILFQTRRERERDGGGERLLNGITFSVFGLYVKNGAWNGIAWLHAQYWTLSLLIGLALPLSFSLSLAYRTAHNSPLESIVWHLRLVSFKCHLWRPVECVCAQAARPLDRPKHDLCKILYSHIPSRKTKTKNWKLKNEKSKWIL